MPADCVTACEEPRHRRALAVLDRAFGIDVRPSAALLGARLSRG